MLIGKGVLTGLEPVGGFYVLSRQFGGFNSLCITEEALGTSATVDIVDDKLVVVPSDKSVTVLGVKFGFLLDAEKLEVNALHTDTSTLFSIFSGSVLLETDDGVMKVSADGSIVPATSEELESATWRTSKEIKETQGFALEVTYRFERKPEIVGKYLQNLIINTEFTYISVREAKGKRTLGVPSISQVYSCKCISFIDAIANGVVLEKFEPVIKTKPTDSFDIEDEEEDIDLLLDDEDEELIEADESEEGDEEESGGLYS